MQLVFDKQLIYAVDLIKDHRCMKNEQNKCSYTLKLRTLA